MPVHKVKGGYKWGKHGHTYPSKAGAERQAKAIYASGYKGKSMDNSINKDITGSMSPNEYNRYERAADTPEFQDEMRQKKQESNREYQQKKHKNPLNYNVRAADPLRARGKNFYGRLSQDLKTQKQRGEDPGPGAPTQAKDYFSPRACVESLKQKFEAKSLLKCSGGAKMAKRIPKPTRLQVAKSLNGVINKLEKAFPKPLPEEDDRYEYGNDGDIQLKPEHRVDAAEHQFGRPGERMSDPSEGKVNKAISPKTKNVLGTAGGAALGAAVGGGNPLGAALGGIAGNELTKDIPEDLHAPAAPKAPSNDGKLKNVLGTAGGAAAGGWAGGPVGAALGGIAGNELTKPPTQTSIKSMEYNLLKCNAELRLRKAIAMTEGYTPMSYVDLVKAFGSTENIPDIMKEEINRPPTSWFETAIMKASNITREPFNFAVKLWYGKDLDISKVNPMAMMAASEAIKDPKKIGEAAEGLGKVGPALSSISEGLGDTTQIPIRAALKTGDKTPTGKLFEYELLGGRQRANKKDDTNVEKLIGGALLGGGIGAATGGFGGILPGAAIGAGAEEVGGRLLGKSVENLEKAGIINDSNRDTVTNAIVDAFIKAVAEPVDSKASPKDRKAKFDFGGESDGIHDGSRSNVHDLADESKTTETN